jgi:hypothetical protein
MKISWKMYPKKLDTVIATYLKGYCFCNVILIYESWIVAQSGIGNG